MGKRRNKYKNKPKSINMITMATLNNPHSTNVHQTIKHNVKTMNDYEINRRLTSSQNMFDKNDTIPPIKAVVSKEYESVDYFELLSIMIQKAIHEENDFCVSFNDSEDFTIIRNFQQFIIQCSYQFDINVRLPTINRKHNIEFFTLNKADDLETVLFDICPAKKLLSIYYPQTFKYNLLDLKINNNSILFKFDYLNSI